MAYLGISLDDVFRASERKCGYRNCENTFVIDHERKVYCSDVCRSSETMYKMRDKKIKKPRGRPVGWRGTHKKKPLGDTIKSRKINLDENGNEI